MTRKQEKAGRQGDVAGWGAGELTRCKSAAAGAALEIDVGAMGSPPTLRHTACLSASS